MHVHLGQVSWFHKALQQNVRKTSIGDFQAPKTLQNTAVLEASSCRDIEARGSAQPPEHAGVESPPLSVQIPDMEPHPPAATQSAGFGSPLPVHFGVSNFESGPATENQRFSQMQHLMQNGMKQSATLARYPLVDLLMKLLPLLLGTYVVDFASA